MCTYIRQKATQTEQEFNGPSQMYMNDEHMANVNNLRELPAPRKRLLGLGKIADSVGNGTAQEQDHYFLS